MFSRLVQSARSLVYNPRANAKQYPHTTDEIMVTARPPPSHPLEDEEEMNDENTINVLVPLSKNKRRKREEVDTSDEVKVKTPSPKKRKTLPVRVKDGEDDKPSSSRPVVEIPAQTMTPRKETANAVDIPQSSAKTKHRRFDSEEPVEEVFSTAREQVTEEGENDEYAENEDENEDSDDDAPEAIGMQEAAQTVKSREKDAARAVQEQKAASRQKRKERDEVLRKQAESIKKRKPMPKVIGSLEQEVITIESDDQEDDVTGSAIDAMDEEEAEVTQTKKLSSTNIPDLLPLEFLEDDDSNEILAIEKQPSKVSKKTKFKDVSEKKSKDRRIGGTTYRVTKVQSKNLAPKAAHNARAVKESWLQGRSGQKVDPNRKPFSKGFFKK